MHRDPKGGEGSQRFLEVPTAPHGDHSMSQQLVSPSLTLFSVQMGSGTLTGSHTMLGATDLPTPRSWPEPGLSQPSCKEEGPKLCKASQAGEAGTALQEDMWPLHRCPTKQGQGAGKDQIMAAMEWSPARCGISVERPSAVSVKCEPRLASSGPHSVRKCSSQSPKAWKCSCGQMGSQVCTHGLARDRALQASLALRIGCRAPVSPDCAGLDCIGPDVQEPDCRRCSPAWPRK